MRLAHKVHRLDLPASMVLSIIWTGVHFELYNITDWLGLVPLFVCMGFGILGLVQWIKRKSICKVDHDILILGGFYIITIAAYLLFESVVIITDLCCRRDFGKHPIRLPQQCS